MFRQWYLNGPTFRPTSPFQILFRAILGVSPCLEKTKRWQFSILRQSCLCSDASTVAAATAIALLRGRSEKATKFEKRRKPRITNETKEILANCGNTSAQYTIVYQHLKQQSCYVMITSMLHDHSGTSCKCHSYPGDSRYSWPVTFAVDLWTKTVTL